MDFLSTQLGIFPLGIWISTIIVTVLALMNLVFQSISLINWKLALKIGAQEMPIDDEDTVNRTQMVLEWGFCVADVISHIIILPLAIYFTLHASFWGFVLISFLFLFYLYIAVMGTAQRIALVKFGLKKSFAQYIPVIKILWGFNIFSIIGLISLWTNAGYFGL